MFILLCVAVVAVLQFQNKLYESQKLTLYLYINIEVFLGKYIVIETRGIAEWAIWWVKIVIIPTKLLIFFTFKGNRQKKDKKVPRGPFSSAAGLYRNVTKTIP